MLHTINFVMDSEKSFTELVPSLYQNTEVGQNDENFSVSINEFWCTAELFSVGIGAISGCAVRMGFNQCFNGIDEFKQNDQIYTPLVLLFYEQPFLVSNMIGSFFMAIFVGNMLNITRISTPLYGSLTTGLCGSITTYGSWMNGVVLGYWDGHTPYLFILLLMESILVYGSYRTGLACVRLFQEIAVLCHSENRTLLPLAETLDTTTTTDITSVIDDIEIDKEKKSSWDGEYWGWCIAYMCIYAVLVWYLLCDMLDTHGLFPAISEQDLTIVKTLSLAPLGAWIRWSIRKFDTGSNNYSDFYIHTLSANLIGTMIAACVSGWGGNWTWGQPCIDGFTGCLTTVSTFITEIQELYAKSPLLALRYVSVTLCGSVFLIHLVLFLSGQLQISSIV